MITLHRLKNQEIVVNADLIEFVESTPDTMISMTTGKKIIVLESVDDVIDKVVQYRQRIHSLKRKRRA